MSKQDKKRRSLFRYYAKQLAHYMPESRGKYVICPHCGVMLDERGLDLDSPQQHRLSLAHVASAAQGGRQLVLACTKCNNLSGTHFESDLQMYLSALNMFRGEGSVVTKVQFGSATEQVSCRMSRGDSGIKFELDPGHNNPAHVQEVSAYLRNGAEEGRISFDIPMGRICRAKRAMFLSAHLRMFWGYGYEYLLSKSMRPLAGLVSVDGLGMTPPVGFVQSEDDHLFDPRYVFIVKDETSNEYLFFHSLYRLCDGTGFGVAIPGPTESSVAAYENLLGQEGSQQGVDWSSRAQYFKMPSPTRLALPESVMAFHKVWYVATGQTD